MNNYGRSYLSNLSIDIDLSACTIPNFIRAIKNFYSLITFCIWESKEYRLNKVFSKYFLLSPNMWMSSLWLSGLSIILKLMIEFMMVKMLLFSIKRELYSRHLMIKLGYGISKMMDFKCFFIITARHFIC